MSELLDFKVTGKVALVTGAARGIGRSCALALAEAGADIALGFRDLHSGETTLEEALKINRKAIGLQMDISDLRQVRNAVKETIRQLGRIDILVNNAGVSPSNNIEDFTVEDFDYTIAVNLKGTYFTSQEAGRSMIENKSGRIINISSQAGFVALPTESVYCLTKAGIVHMTRCFAAEWAKHNINVNAVAPTFIETPGTEPWLKRPDFRAGVLSKIQLGRIGIPPEVSSAVVFLASPAASLITGSTLLIDGGWTAV